MEFTFTKLMIDKPECKACKKDQQLNGLLADLLYSLFNPYYREDGHFDPTELIKKYLKDDLKKLDSNPFFREVIRDLGFLDGYWTEQLEKYQVAKKMVWEKLKEMLEKGEIKRDELSANQLVENFFDEVVEDLKKSGYIKCVEGKFHRRVVKYNAIAEKIIGDKILSIALEELDRKSRGEHITEREGISIFSGENLVDFDPLLHSFDNIDLCESLVKSAIKGRIELEDIVARQTKHAEKCVYVMLIDVSDSMRGKKIIGAIEAGIALRRAIDRNRNDDELEIVAFNHRAFRIRREEILNLEPRGRTDIGLALKTARKILSERSGTGIIFLISDGEPTSSYDPSITPWVCALREARALRKINAKLQIVMFGNEGRFLEFCTQMAKLCGNSRLFHFSDPLNLKKYILRRF
ncbi:MAG: Ca-activated chloride channel [Archaeoglobaceae archaeon]|nr:Ca-activated chloride channel [Archaeoglobaceae archaeon]MDK2875773.1 Ca-activated chloride channel [Archaeoglobaceae archaeon]